MKGLPIAAGSYPCTWFIGNDRLSGDLQLAGARGPRGAAFEVPGVWTDSGTEESPSRRTFRPHTVEMPVLRGRLRPNHDVLLVDARIRHIFPEQSEVTARMALCGRWFPRGDSELMFSSVEFQVGGLTELARIKALSGVSPGDVAWLKEWVKTIGSYKLEYRLREVVEKDLPAGLRTHIQARTATMPAVLEGIVENATDIWQVMGTVRNRIAHGGREPTLDQLQVLTRLAHTVTIGLALQQLGVPDTDLTRAIDHHVWLVY